MNSEGEPAQREIYWNKFYENSLKSLVREPSKFAELVATSIAKSSRVFEFGCGNGRDSVFFADLGHDVVAIDGSASAINEVNTVIRENKLSNIRTIQAKIDDPGLVERLRSYNQPRNEIQPLGIVVYARFFLHALTALEQAKFLAIAIQLMERGGLLALEFRTCDDQFGPKSTPMHYRRYIDPENFAKDMGELGLQIVYRQQGRGLARHGIDDAHVARFILRRSGGLA